MGFQVKEMLKQICNNNGWSYGVFWRINCSNPMLLMPEDFYYEPSRNSRVFDSSSVTKHWEALSEQACSILVKPEEERIAMLIEKIYQVHMVGEGLIGRVASTGKHQWIFQDAFCGRQCWIGPVGNQTMSQDTAELQHQFSAGIKTIAIVSVAPHGVVQFGSTQKSMENLMIVEDIKSLFLQMGNLPGTFLSGNIQNSLNNTVSSSAAFGNFASMVSSGNFYSEPTNFKSLSDDVFRDQMVKTQFSTILTQSSNPSACWLSIPPHDLTVAVSSNSHVTINSTDSVKKTDLYPRNPAFHLTNQSQTAGNMRLPHVLLQSNSDSVNGNRHLVTSKPKTSFCSDFSTLTSMEQQLLSGMGVKGSENIFPSEASALDPCRATLPNMRGMFTLNTSLGTSGSLDTIIHPSPFEIKNDLYAQPCSSLPLQVPQEFRPVHDESDCSKPDLANNLAPCTASPLEPVNNDSLGSIDDDLLQALNSGVLSSGFAGADGQTWFGDNCVKYVQKPMLDSLSDGIRSVVENQGSDAVGDAKQKSLNAPMQLPSIDELFDGSGLDFVDNHQKACWDDIILPIGGVDYSNFSSGISELGTVSMIGLEKGCYSEIGSDHLLDAVVNVSSSTNKNSDDLSSKSTLTRASSSCLYDSSGYLVGLSRMRENVDNCLPTNEEGTLRGSQKEMPSRSQISSWVEQSQSINAENAIFGQSRTAKEPPKVIRKRARPGESTRPRPKDRQQIQDRVKELREIVPNGAKCSIDALLDRTIRHMCFLQSVTKHADKLKHASEPKRIGMKNDSVLKDAAEVGGATWGFEVAGQSMVCPIRVEDLNPPGQMLVEMHCEEHGLFLEIADIIRGFGLTILKGVMESRDDKIWAWFIVEANVEVTRMDIILSLVQLLEQTSKNNTSPCSQSSKAIDSGGPIFTTCQPPMSLPVGLAGNLQ